MGRKKVQRTETTRGRNKGRISDDGNEGVWGHSPLSQRAGKSGRGRRRRERRRERRKREALLGDYGL